MVYGGAMYIMNHCDVTFEENCTVKFNNNIAKYGGAAHIKEYNTAVTFKGNSSVLFNNNEAKSDGGAICIGDRSEIIVTFKENSKVSFSNNKASEYGGVLYISHIANSPFTFSGNSKITFNNNSANNGGVCIFLLLLCQHKAYLGIYRKIKKQYLVTMNLKIKVELYVWRAVILVLMTTATPSNLLIIPE